MNYTDSLPIEIQYNNICKSEDSYRLNTFKGQQAFNWVVERYPNALNYIENIELISLSPIDKLTVNKQSATIVLYTRPDKDLLDYRAIKIDQDGSLTFKYYSADYDKHPTIELPFGSKIASQFGIGHYPKQNQVYDIYFFHNDVEVVENFFKTQIDMPESVRSFRLGLYGVSYLSDGTFKKLKRYFFPHDKEINNPHLL